MLRKRKFQLIAIALVAAILFALTPGGRKAIAQADIFSLFLVQYEARTPSIGAYPSGSTVLQATSGTVAAATATATLTSAAAKMAWIFGFDVNGGGATAASIVDCTVTGLVGATAHFSLPVPAGATGPLTPLSVRFPEPIPASAVNTNIVVSCPTLGAGNTNATVNAYGFLTTATGP